MNTNESARTCEPAHRKQIGAAHVSDRFSSLHALRRFLWSRFVDVIMMASNVDAGTEANRGRVSRQYQADTWCWNAIVLSPHRAIVKYTVTNLGGFVRLTKGHAGYIFYS